jgi:hypothetical protein
MYTPDDYDKHSCLKPSVGLYVAILYSMKDVVLIIVEALSKLKAKGGPNRLEYFEDLVQPEMILVNIIGLLLFVSIIKREPKEQGIWKKIFTNGQSLLIAALSLHLIILGIEQFLQMSEAYRWSKGVSMPLIYMMFVDAIFILYVASSQRVKDTFTDWPKMQ